MHRRKFLTHLVSVSGLAVAAKTLPVWASESMKGMHDMSGMHDMASMEDRDHAGISLASNDAIPTGRSLAAPAMLENEATEPGKFKARLIAAPTEVSLIPDTVTQAWTYNGHMPGPLIDLQAGDEVEITLENRLTQPTTIHWHGLPVPPDQDGNPSAAVAPGDTHVYRFKIPEITEGLYWYHPHPHEISGEQVYRGLAGPIRIHPKNDPLAEIPERILAISDLRLTKNGAIPDDTMMDWMNGRVGQFALVNGMNRPLLPFHTGGQERWHLLNATSARYLRLTLPGHRFTLLGTDGGRIEQARTDLEEILLAPAQRVELLVTATGQQHARLMAASYDRGKMGGAPETPPLSLMNIDFGKARANVSTALPQSLRDFPALPRATTHKRIVMSESMPMNGMSKDHMMNPSTMKFLLNGKTFDMNRIDLKSRVGAWEDWEIINDSDMDHPFHVHGTQFAVLERALGGHKRIEPFRAWYDTVNLKSHETVRIRIMQSQRGIRMFHCHILEHEDLGMMGRLSVS